MRKAKMHPNKWLREQLIMTGRLVKNKDGEYEESNDFNSRTDLRPAPQKVKHWNNKREMKKFKKALRDKNVEIFQDEKKEKTSIKSRRRPKNSK